MLDRTRQWDCDRNNAISKEEFRTALTQLKIHGTAVDYDALFDAWDVDRSGTLQVRANL